jgi:hypothetical protein
MARRVPRIRWRWIVGAIIVVAFVLVALPIVLALLPTHVGFSTLGQAHP